MKKLFLILCMFLSVQIAANAQVAAAVVGSAIVGHEVRRHPVRTAIVVGAGMYLYHCLSKKPGGEPPKGCIRLKKNSEGETLSEAQTIVSSDVMEQEPDQGGVITKYNPAKAANLRKLKSNLRGEAEAAGMPPEPPDDCEAHHIVPDLEGRPAFKTYADIARASIQGCVDINSAENGVYLPGKKDGSSQCSGSYHKTLHNESYYRNISFRLQQAEAAGGCAEVRDELLSIKDELKMGKL